MAMAWVFAFILMLIVALPVLWLLGWAHDYLFGGTHQSMRRGGGRPVS